MAEQSLYEKLKDLDTFEKEIQAEKSILIEKGLKSSSPRDVVAATKILQNQRSQASGVKAYFIDPLNTQNINGFRARPLIDLSFNTLRSMAKQTGIVSAIITTRKEQVASYNSFTTDNIIPGWTIEKNIKNYFKDEELEKAKKLSKYERQEASELISFIENCGVKGRIYDKDDFDSFLRKFVDDSLTIDNACFEIIYSQFGTPYEFAMVDGATMRFASVEAAENFEERRGYHPNSVQLYQNAPYTYFYPWEMCMGIRNPITNYLYNGYGCSELEVLIKIVTYILNAEAYTGKFFTQGSYPKGMFIAKDVISEDKLQEFRQTWQSQTVGLTGAHKIPIISGAEISWQDMSTSNKDMEFSSWLEYNTRLACCIFKIDPKELGINLTSDGGVNYESSVQEKINYSKEKGLIPLLKFIENKINRYIISPLSHDKFRFRFTGIDNSASLIEDIDIKRVEKGVMSFKEYRAKHGLPTELEEDDFLLNSTWIQYIQAKGQGQGQQQGGLGGMMGGMGMPMGMPQQENQEQKNVFGGENTHNHSHSIFKDFVEGNPFARDLDNWLINKGWKNKN